MAKMNKQGDETVNPLAAGDHLRSWRQRRRMSQMSFALEAEISQRHLSFIESGRAAPSREMLLHLAERLDIPLRERNTMLLAAGFAPIYVEHNLNDPAMKVAREAIERVLQGHEPYPALAVDRHWNLVIANAALTPLLADIVDSSLLQPPINVLRLSLHPKGLAPRIINLPEWREHLLARLHRQITVTNDTLLVELWQELSSYPVVTHSCEAMNSTEPVERDGLFVPLKLMIETGVLSFISTTTMFGTPRDIMLSELAIEAFFPADLETKNLLLQQHT